MSGVRRPSNCVICIVLTPPCIKFVSRGVMGCVMCDYHPTEWKYIYLMPLNIHIFVRNSFLNVFVSFFKLRVLMKRQIQFGPEH